MAELSYIIRTEYRKKGYVKVLLEYLIELSKNKYNYDLVKVQIFKNNSASITLIENSDFEFVNFDRKTITFQKKIKRLVSKLC